MPIRAEGIGNWSGREINLTDVRKTIIIGMSSLLSVSYRMIIDIYRLTVPKVPGLYSKIIKTKTGFRFCLL